MTEFHFKKNVEKSKGDEDNIFLGKIITLKHKIIMIQVKHVLWDNC